MNTIIFLNKIRRIKYFSIFQDNTYSDINLMKLKYNRLSQELKKKEVLTFCNIVSNDIYKKFIEYDNVNKINQFRQKNSIHRIMKSDCRNAIKVRKLEQHFKNMRTQIIYSSMKESLREFCLEDKLKKNKINSFFFCLKQKRYRNTSL